jgi:hypothetical protein
MLDGLLSFPIQLFPGFLQISIVHFDLFLDYYQAVILEGCDNILAAGLATVSGERTWEASMNLVNSAPVKTVAPIVCGSGIC